MPSHEQFTVNVVVGDANLDEYEVTRKDNTYSCWIASEEGKNLAIRWNTEASNESYRCEVFMDGSFVKGRVYKPQMGCSEDLIRGCSISLDTVRLFAFSRVSLTDDDAIADADQQTPKLGTIEIKIYRIEVIRRFKLEFTDPENILNGSVIHERSKKMSMHNVTFQGEGRRPPNKKGITTRNLDKNPCVSFIFTYRPKEFLIAQGIIPPTNSEDNLPRSSSDGIPTRKRKRNEGTSSGNASTNHPFDDEEESEENIQQLRQTLRDVQARLDAMEQRKSSRPVKQEIKHEPKVFPVDANGVIDLSSD